MHPIFLADMGHHLEAKLVEDEWDLIPKFFRYADPYPMTIKDQV